MEESNEKLDFMEFKSTATENSNNVSFRSMSFQSHDVSAEAAILLCTVREAANLENHLKFIP